MIHIEIIGTLAAACTTVSFLPQVVKIYRTKMTRDLSMPMYAIFAIGVFLWTVYGLLTKSGPIVWANTVTFILCMYIIAMKIRHK